MMYCYSVHEKFIAMKTFCRSSKEYYGAIMLDVKSNMLKTNMQEELPKISTCKAQFIHKSMVYFHYKCWWDRLIKDMVESATRMMAVQEIRFHDSNEEYENCVDDMN